MSEKLFGTNGIRFIPSTFHDIEFTLKVAEAIGTYFSRGELLLGRDGRTSSLSLYSVVSSGLMSTGINVAEAGLVPTPALQYCVRELGFEGGIMITASHNPPEYNGLKVIGKNGIEIPRDEERKIEEIFFGEKFSRADWKGVGNSRQETTVVKRYIEGIISKVNQERIKEKKFTVVMDLGNGAQCVAAPYLAERLGVKLITINSVIDGRFPGRGPEPVPEKLQELSTAVRSVGADFGVAYDGDGDRAIFCDETGKILWGDQSGALLMDYICSTEKGITVVTPVSTSQAVDYVANKRGARVIRTKVGSVDVSNTILSVNAKIGFEENGGFIYAPHIQVRDGAMTTALMLDFLSCTEKGLSQELKERIPSFFQAKTKVQVRREKMNEIIEKIDRKTEGRKERIDGIKIWTDENSWVLIRPSGTEPIIRIFAESDKKEKLEGLLKEFVGLVQSLK